MDILFEGGPLANKIITREPVKRIPMQNGAYIQTERSRTIKGRRFHVFEYKADVVPDKLSFAEHEAPTYRRRGRGSGKK